MGFFARQTLKRAWKHIGKRDLRRLATQKPTPGIEGDYEIYYTGDRDPLLSLDVYYPKGTEGLLPVIFDIHGGGWMYGSKEINRNYCLSLASRGFAVVNINYRLCPEADLEAQINDIFRALHWLGAHGAEHHCDTENVFVTGDSAGGHLSTLAVALSVEPTLLSLYSIKKLPFPIRAIAATHIAPDVCGGMQGSKASNKSINREYKRMLFGKRPDANLIFYKATIYTTAKPETYPPILVVTSEADDLYPHSQKLIDFLKEKGFRYETAIAEPNPKSKHVFNVAHPDRKDGILMNDRIAGFFRGKINAERLLADERARPAGTRGLSADDFENNVTVQYR